MKRVTPGRVAVVAVLLVGVALWWPVSDEATETNMSSAPAANRMDLSAFSDSSPGRDIDLLFIHHSCGGQLLAPVGPDEGAQCIYTSHPNGGGLRALLGAQGYIVNEASYGSRVGDRTDVFDWLPKFRGQMDEILACARQDEPLPAGRHNRIVMFKSCFPNNKFSGEGEPPGDPAGPALTVWNAKATYAALLDEFRKQPDVLFVCVTAPPLAPKQKAIPLWRKSLAQARGRYVELEDGARRARQFNNWLSDTNGWLRDYGAKNVVVFDYYDVLTAGGESDLSRFATGDGTDSHPSAEGNGKAAEAFVPFLNRAVRRAGLTVAP